MEERKLSVSELNTIIKNIFDAEEMLYGIKVYGEVSSLSIVRGVAYFSLKDDGAVLSCVMFGAEKLAVKDGDQVVLTGTPKYYVKGGRLNFNVSKLEPYGQGLLFKQFLLLKQKLESEGLFDLSHKKQIPENVKKIGVVSSEGGAVIQDIINVSSRRDKSVSIVLYPVKVQGVNAEYEIVKGIEFFNNYDVDVVIVARGGGSMEDLQPFNTEIVARAVYNCNKPLISAVGHETDFTIIDFVSDLRAPTPSAAAEIAVVDKQGKIDQMKRNITRLNQLTTLFIGAKSAQFRLDYRDIIAVSDKFLSKVRMTQNTLTQKMITISDSFVKDREYELGLNTSNLKKLNPTTILEMGYSKLEQNGKVLQSVEGLNVDEELIAYLSDGKVISKPIRIEKGERI